MSEKEYIVFCDESATSGKFYSNFYGGLIIGASQYNRVTQTLEEAKLDLHFHNEVKWQKVTENYLVKYQELIKLFFSEVKNGNVKVRLMFRQNAHRPQGLTNEDREKQYYKLYYQFIKHAFGLRYVPPTESGTRLRLYFDQFPDTKDKSVEFKEYLLRLNHNPFFLAANLTLHKEDITEVRSHDHVLLQCLDIVLGSMNFRLNGLHQEKLPETNRRGKRTIAKEKLYKTILSEIRQTKSNFNIGITTGFGEQGFGSRWQHVYRHWCFQSRTTVYDKTLTKRGQKKSPA